MSSDNGASGLEERHPADAVDETLYSLGRHYGRTILLLDRFGTDPLAESIAALDGPLPLSLPLDDAIFSDDPASAPLLVELQHAIPSHQSLLHLSIHMALEQASRKSGPHPVCAWLFSATPLARLQASLRHRLDARYPDHSVYFRYFDPRVMPHLVRIMPLVNDAPSPANSSFSDLLGPVDVWCQIDSFGKLLCHKNPVPAKANHLVELHFAAPAVAALARIELINLTRQHLDLRHFAGEPGVDAVVDGHLAHALTCGLQDSDDQVSYAWRATKYGSAFTRHPELNDCMQEAKSIGIPLEPFLGDRLPQFV